MIATALFLSASLRFNSLLKFLPSRCLAYTSVATISLPRVMISVGTVAPLRSRNASRSSQRRIDTWNRGGELLSKSNSAQPPTGRPVGVRARLHQWRASRSPHSRLPGRADDPDLPWKLAQHFDHRRIDSAFDSNVDHRA